MSIQLNFRKSGEGPPLVILHGVFGSGENWLTVSKQFMPHFEVYLVDQRNHGRSPHSPDFSYDVLVQDVYDFAQQHNLSKFILIGHSMGGKVAMKFASKFPEMLEKLVVVDIAPRYYKPHHQEVMAAFRSVQLEEMKTRNEADAAMASHLPDVDTRQFLLKNLYRTEDGNFAWRINLSVLENAVDNIGEPLDEQIRIAVPTLFIRGEKSKYISDKDIPQIGTQFTNSRVVTIPNAGHWVQAEQPDAFAHAVLQFLLTENK